MDRELKNLVLSTLLHDIGKFAWRADRPFSKGTESGRYRHVLYTDHFIKKDLPLPAEWEEFRPEIAGIASAHHRPDKDSRPEMCLMIADRLSSGADSAGYEESGAGRERGRLVSVFDEIELVSHRFTSPGKYFHNLFPSEPGSDGMFPRGGKLKGQARDYESLFSRFLSELGKLKDAAVPFYMESLISLLEKYTWCIPSSTSETLPDVSLFDHALSAAGISQALYLWHRHQDTVPRWDDEDAKFVILAGELSGIQDYVFSIRENSDPGLSNIFRARSFFVQAVTKSVLIEIQRRLGLFSVCQMANSGSRFILLLPRTPVFMEHLDDLEESVQMWFRKRFKGVLTMNLSWSVQLKHEDFCLKNFGSEIDAVNEALEASKYHKLRKTFAQSGPVIEEDYDESEGGNCSLCGLHSVAEPDIPEPVCSDCGDQISYIGTRLPRTDYLIYKADGNIPLFGDIRLTLSEVPPSDPSDVFHVETLKDIGTFSKSRMTKHLPQLTKKELGDRRWMNLFREEGRELGPDQPKTFTMIAHKAKKESRDRLRGRSLLAFFKADVDNLGLIFSMGLEERLSAARFSSLSRMLNLFFSEYLVELLKKEFPDIYVVFAGGDDLFLIGPWRQTIQFSLMLRKKFSHFCARNPDITLSAGILIAKPGLPIKRASALVEENLKEAKKVHGPDRIKNSVSFLGNTLSWEKLEELMNIGNQFDKAVEEKARTNFSTAFLYRLLAYYKMYWKFAHEKKISFGRYLALAHYDIGRNIRTSKKHNQPELDMLYQIFAVGPSGRGAELDMLNIPLFYAINLNRE
ncbi:type III-A CRISPR-associated protein Cas10/Csm1 [Desulfobacterales bacterium HSG2]|nr:type III-A CRISPR-associated protein Cas10/Csm1 [Desulfobacterales bacterium HSG2]